MKLWWNRANIHFCTFLFYFFKCTTCYQNEMCARFCISHVNDMKEMNVLSHCCRMDVTKNLPKTENGIHRMDEFSRIVRTMFSCCMYSIYGNQFIRLRRTGGGGFFLPQLVCVGLRRIKRTHHNSSVFGVEELGRRA